MSEEEEIKKCPLCKGEMELIETKLVADTKYNIPINFRPVENAPHVIRWWVQPVRQSGTTDEGDTIWVPAGSQSNPRVFSWSGISAAVTQAP